MSAAAPAVRAGGTPGARGDAGAARDFGRPGACGEPSFNACRESCRGLVYHCNLLISQLGAERSGARARMMILLTSPLHLSVAGKLQGQRLGEFCCTSRLLTNAPE